MDVDTNAGRGEQVITHYLPGAVTTYERKNYRKHCIKLKENLKNSVRQRVQNNSNYPIGKGRETCTAMVKKVGADHTDDVSRKQGNGR